MGKSHTINVRRPSASGMISSETVRAAINSASREPAAYPLNHTIISHKCSIDMPPYLCVTAGDGASLESPDGRMPGLIAVGVR